MFPVTKEFARHIMANIPPRILAGNPPICFLSPSFIVYIAPPRYPSGEDLRYFTASTTSPYFTLIEITAPIHIHITAPAPPAVIAVATPAIFPTPSVPARAVHKAFTGDSPPFADESERVLKNALGLMIWQSLIDLASTIPHSRSKAGIIYPLSSDTKCSTDDTSI